MPKRSDLSAYGDGALLDMMRGGDEGAFTAIYERYWGRLFYLASKKTRSCEEGEHIVQEIFLDLWVRRETALIDHVAAYLTAAVKYRIINYLARQDRHRVYQTQIMTAATDAASCATAKENVVEQWMDFEELRDWLEKCVAELPEKCRIVYQLRDKGLTYKEIAREMNVSEKTVENHIGAALRKLKTRLSHFLFSLFF